VLVVFIGVAPLADLSGGGLPTALGWALAAVASRRWWSLTRPAKRLDPGASPGDQPAGSTW
jgi:hypothetical protein